MRATSSAARKRLAHEVVGARRERAGDLVVGVERGQHDDRQVRGAGRLGARAGRCSRRAAGITRSSSTSDGTLRESHCERLGAGRSPTCSRSAAVERLREHVAADGVVVDDQDGRAAGHDRLD